jgi:hypothetical protein
MLQRPLPKEDPKMLRLSLYPLVDWIPCFDSLVGWVVENHPTTTNELSIASNYGGCIQ